MPCGKQNSLKAKVMGPPRKPSFGTRAKSCGMTRTPISTSKRVVVRRAPEPSETENPKRGAKLSSRAKANGTVTQRRNQDLGPLAGSHGVAGTECSASSEMTSSSARALPPRNQAKKKRPLKRWHPRRGCGHSALRGDRRRGGSARGLSDDRDNRPCCHGGGGVPRIRRVPRWVVGPGRRTLGGGIK